MVLMQFLALRSNDHQRARARLLRAEADPLRFISISDWDDDSSLKAWKASPGFRQKIESVKELCEGFVGGDYEVTTAILAPALRS